MLTLYLLGGAVLDRFVFPEPAPDESYYPPVGYVFGSKMEGFEQHILQREDGLFWLELTMGPNAPGPPEHVHTSFSERFMVAEGTLSLLVNGEVRELGRSGSFLVSPGTPHKPFNRTKQTGRRARPADRGVRDSRAVQPFFSRRLTASLTKTRRTSKFPRRCFRCRASALFTIRGRPTHPCRSSGSYSTPSDRRRVFWGIGRTIRVSSRAEHPRVTFLLRIWIVRRSKRLSSSETK